MPLNLNTIDEIIKALQLGQIAFDEAVRMILALKAQGNLSDQEIHDKTAGLVVEERNLLNELGNASLREDS